MNPGQSWSEPEALVPGATEPAAHAAAREAQRETRVWDGC
jgi:hypothetical protein